MRKGKSISFILSALLIGFMLIFSGCGSENRQGVQSVAQRVGDTKCVQCHSSTPDKITGESIVSQYNRSKHVTADNAGCEGCHGNGSQHNGIGPIPYPKPDVAICESCHNGTNASKTSAAKWANSNHAKPYEETTNAPCYRCHTSEGAILSNILGYTGDKDGVLLNNSYRPVLSVDNSTFKMQINCETCHEHGGNLRTVKATDPATGSIVAWDPNRNFKVDEFDLCTSCHLFYNYNGSQMIASGKNFNTTAYTNGVSVAVNTLKNYHETAWFRTLPTTHYDIPDSGRGSSHESVIQGYVIRKNSENPCFDCHGHDFIANTRPDTTRPTTIYTDWAKSAHAGHLYEVKYTAYSSSTYGKRQRNQDKVNYVMQAGVTKTTGPGWAYYNWDHSARQACQRCHTSTGLSNFLNNPVSYNAATNNFAHLENYSSFSGSRQNELLYCWGCHSNAGTGDLRNPGALNFTYSNDAKVTYPDLKGSNICMACHTGRETGDSIKKSLGNFSSISFINSHYLAAGGQLFGTTGYEYAGKDYSNPPYFKHDKIGITESLAITKNGPCVGCHMTTDNSHLFTNVERDNSGAITKITSKVCVNCHVGDYALTASNLTEEEENYKAAIDAAKALMANKGIHFQERHPYWFVSPAPDAGSFRNWASIYGQAKAKDVMGAAFNINLLAHDPGGYAHNRIYVKRLLWDSIDFMDNGVLGDVDMATLIDSLSLTATQKSAAKAYLGTTRP